MEWHEIEEALTDLETDRGRVGATEADPKAALGELVTGDVSRRPGPRRAPGAYTAGMRGSASLALLVAALAVLGCGSAAERPRAAQRPGSARPTATLYLANATPGQLTIVDVARRRVEKRHLRELAPGDPPYMIAVRGRRLVVFGHDHTYAFGPGLREPARDLGESWFFVPSASAGRVWLALLDPRSPATVNALREVREVTVDGRVTVVRSRRPPRWPFAALRSGLVLQHTTLELWDPATGRITQRLPGVFPVAARDWRVVSCAAGCRVLHVSDTRSGARTVIRPGRDFRFVESYDGAFSPDGKLVAVPAVGRRGEPHVVLVDLARSVTTLVRGPHLARDYQLLAWSSSGWLFYNAGRGRIAAYRPGGATATLLPLHVAPFVDIAAR